jgi:hypothetical protein
MIAFEPGVTDKDNSQRIKANFAATAWSWLRPDVFRNRKAASEELAKNRMYATWDPRSFELFVVCHDYEIFFSSIGLIKPSRNTRS